MKITPEVLDIASKYHTLHNYCVMCDCKKVKHFLAVDVKFVKFDLNGFIWLASLCKECTKSYSNNCKLIPLSKKEIFYIQINAK